MRTRSHLPSAAALGAVLRAFREKRGLSQEELGFKAGLHRNYVGGVERGERNPSFQSLSRWLDALRVSWREFGDAIDRKSGSGN